MTNKNTQQTYHNRPFADSFAAFRNTRQPRAEARDRTEQITLPAVKNWMEDGEDHINTHHHASTELGKALSMYGDYEFYHAQYGRFRTVHGLISWLADSNQPDEYRTMTAFMVQHNRQARVNDLYIANFHYLIVEATWQKIKAYPELQKALAECHLPFDYYYYNYVRGESNSKNKVRIRNSSSRWLIAGFDELRNAARENREPELDFLNTKPVTASKQSKGKSFKSRENNQTHFRNNSTGGYPAGEMNVQVATGLKLVKTADTSGVVNQPPNWPIVESSPALFESADTPAPTVGDVVAVTVPQEQPPVVTTDVVDNHE